MTRRIALAILATCWLVLLAGGSVAYVAIRGALLDELDESLVRRASLLPDVRGDADGVPGYAIPSGDRYVVRGANGQTLARSGMRASTARKVERRGAHFAALADGERVRSVSLAFPGADGKAELVVVYSSSAERYDRLISRLWLTFATVALAAGLLTAGMALVVARVALRPLTAAANTVASIDDRSLDRRLDVAALPSELQPMGQRLNQMLGRLEDGLRQRKQFMADAAHELRTPVSALMTSMEVAVRYPRDAEALTGVLHECLGDVRVLRRLVQALLEEFRADSFAGWPALQTTDVSHIFDLCLDAVASTARLKGVQVKRLYDADVRIVTEPQRLRSIVSNLLDNALEYNVSGGIVELSCAVDAETVTIGVRDTGHGIGADLLPRVFEPFFRADDSAKPASGHCGLGLYLVKSHAEALGGTCTVRSVVGRGTEFAVRLPVNVAAIEGASAATNAKTNPAAAAASASAPAVICFALTAFSCSSSILGGVS